MSAYYNEFDPAAAAWLRELIKRGLIAKGEVDERSIVDVHPDDVRGFTQCHFFAGIGGWSYSLRLAGWPDDRCVWTGSPPCQPFSAAGKQLGKDDARHLAPKFISLVRACRPEVLFGEQVASAAVFGSPSSGAKRGSASAPQWAWLDDLSDRLEAARYAVGSSDIPAAGVGAPHIRQRTFFGAVRLADAERLERREIGVCGHQQADGAEGGGEADKSARDRDGNRLANADDTGPQGQRCKSGKQHLQEGREVSAGYGPEAGYAGGLADASDSGCSEGRERVASTGYDGLVENGGLVAGRSATGAAEGVWGDPDWLHCRDAKWRTVEPGTFPLAHGIPARVGRLRGYGNAIVPQAAAEFIAAFCAALGGGHVY